MIRSSALCIAATLALFGCKKEATPEAPKAMPEAQANAATPVPSNTPAPTISAASVLGHSDPECVGPIEQGVPSELTIGGRKAELNGYRLTFKDKDADDHVVLGVLGNINEDSPENLFNLKRYLEFFKAEKAEAILVTGDTGESSESIQRALRPLAESGLPVFVVIGNRECRADFNDAMIELQKKYTNVVNLDRVRYVDFDDVDLISLPGYHDPRFIHCKTGCQYFKQDVDALKELAQKANDPVVLVAHGPPQGQAPTAIDAATEVGNVGDASLNGLIAEAKIPFGVFSNIKEAGGRATDLSGVNMIKDDTFAEALYLNPGPADSVAWKMNDGTESVGMAATLLIKGKQAKYHVYRAKRLSEAEKAQRLGAGASKAPEQPAEAQAVAPK